MFPRFAPDPDREAGNLDLSMHWPSSPFHNRFSVLSPVESPFESPPPRRFRKSRGSKEGKKRRDARRYQRKWAAHRAVTHSVPIRPSNAVVPYAPPSLPVFNFGVDRFDLSDFSTDFMAPGMWSPPATPPPVWSPPATPPPIWRPAETTKQPMRTLPLFFDLSSLPEPKERPWRDLKPKVSRFFPLQFNIPIVRLPQISNSPYNFAAVDDMVGGPEGPVMPTLLDEADPKLSTLVNPTEIDQDWKVGTSDMPAELDGSEVPYVHANSLIGPANDRATDHLTPDEETSTCVENLLEAWRLFVEARDLATTPAISWSDESDVPDVDDNESDAQYLSEQELFEAPAEPVDSVIDLATFLAMGHVENCWCQDCSEEPSIVVVEEDKLDEEDGWMVWV